MEPTVQIPLPCCPFSFASHLLLRWRQHVKLRQPLHRLLDAILGVDDVVPARLAIQLHGHPPEGGRRDKA